MHSPNPSLRRVLGPWQLIGIGVGSTLGAGLFSLTGIAAGAHAGPAVTLSFLIAGLGCGLTALCYAELAAMIPASGSAYTYAMWTAGRAVAWIVGWDLVLEYAVSAATVAVSWSGYLASILQGAGIVLPHAIMAGPLDLEPGLINLPAALVLCLCSVLLIRGVEGSAKINLAITAAKVLIVVLFIGVGVFYVDARNYVPYVPANTGSFGEFGWSGVLRAAGLIFFAYIGFDAVSTAAREAKNPQRDMPIGLLGSLLICTVLFILFAHVLTGLVPWTELADDPAPIATAIGRTPFPFLRVLIEVTILFGFLAVILVTLYGQSRIFLAMSDDRLLPPAFGAIHPRFRTPWRADQATMVFGGLLAGFVPLNDLGELTSIGTLLAFSMVCVGVLVLRRRRPDLPRPFRTPLMPFVPILGIVVCGAMMLSLDGASWVRLVVWLAIGQVIWLLYGRRQPAPPNPAALP